MKVFVAGGTGVIGRRAVAVLVGAGHAVSALARSPHSAEVVRSTGAAPVDASLFDAESLTSVVDGNDVVVNLATHIPPMSKSARASAWEENDRIRIEGARNLAAAALAGGAGRYIQESIAFVYADHGDEWIYESEPQIDTPYTDGVAHAEASAARFRDDGGVGVVLRFGQFYAPDAVHSISMLKGARRGWAMLPGAPTAYAAPIHADDAASAVLCALDAPSGTYNIVDDDPVTRREWSSAMAGVVGRQSLRPLPKAVQRLVRKRTPNLVSSQRVSNASFKGVTSWSPSYRSFREGAVTLVDWPTDARSTT